LEQKEQISCENQKVPMIHPAQWKFKCKRWE